MLARTSRRGGDPAGNHQRRARSVSRDLSVRAGRFPISTTETEVDEGRDRFYENFRHASLGSWPTIVGNVRPSCSGISWVS